MNLSLKQLISTSEIRYTVGQYGVLIMEYHSCLYKGIIYRPTQEGIPELVNRTKIYTTSEEVMVEALDIIELKHTKNII